VAQNLNMKNGPERAKTLAVATTRMRRPFFVDSRFAANF
jgi:hypothetical protein